MLRDLIENLNLQLIIEEDSFILLTILHFNMVSTNSL